jgi:hypothetical protein
MTSMWKRGSQRHYPGAAIIAARLSDGLGNASVCLRQRRLSSTGSPP